MFSSSFHFASFCPVSSIEIIVIVSPLRIAAILTAHIRVFTICVLTLSDPRFSDLRIEIWTFNMTLEAKYSMNTLKILSKIWDWIGGQYKKFNVFFKMVDGQIWPMIFRTSCCNFSTNPPPPFNTPCPLHIFHNPLPLARYVIYWRLKCFN